MHPMKKLVVAALAASAGTLTASPALALNPEQGADREFTMMDTDRDGKVSADEHASGARTMFGKMDTNKDGQVTAQEMTASHAAVTGQAAKPSDMSSAEKIKVVDADGDGRLTAEEHARGSDSMFGQMDGDKDGFLSRDEMARGHAGMMRK